MQVASGLAEACAEDRLPFGPCYIYQHAPAGLGDGSVGLGDGSAGLATADVFRGWGGEVAGVSVGGVGGGH